jgi:O-antigen ligase
MPTSGYNDLVRRLVTQRDVALIVASVVGLAVAWIVGKSIAGMQFGVPLALAGFVVFLLAFFRPHSLAFLAPAILALPNIGLDLPGPWAITTEDAFVLIAFSGYLTRSLIRRQYIIPRDDKVVLPLLIFNGIAILCLSQVALVSPQNITFNIKELLRLTLLNLFYITMIDVLDSKRQVLRLVKWLLVFSIWMMGVSFYIYATKSPFWYYILTMTPAYLFLRAKILRLVSIAGSTSYTGIYYAVILALATHYLPLVIYRARQLVAWALWFFLFAAIVLTFNRGTWVGILFGLAMLTLHGQISARRIIWVGLLAAAIVALMSTEIFGELHIEERVTEFVYYSSSSAQSRLVRWISAVNAILDHPLLGVGYNNYAFVYGRYSIFEGVQPMYGSPHNMYVDILTGTGFIGFAFFMAAIVRLWRRMRDNMRLVVDPEMKLLSRGIFLAFLFFLGSGGFDSFLFKPHHSSYVIVSLWAMATAIYRMRRGTIYDPGVTPAEAAPATGEHAS